MFYEAVHRVAETLAALREAFGAERRAALARELTKMHEQIATGTLGELDARLGGDIPLLGEFVIVVAGAAGRRARRGRRAARLRALAAELEPDKALQLDRARSRAWRATRSTGCRALRAGAIAAACEYTSARESAGQSLGSHPGGKSGLHRAGCQVTPGRREPTESATENIPPAGTAGKGEKVR